MGAAEGESVPFEIFLLPRAQVGRQPIHRTYEIADGIERGAAPLPQTSKAQPFANNVRFRHLALARLDFDLSGEMLGQSNAEGLHGMLLVHLWRRAIQAALCRCRS